MLRYTLLVCGWISLGLGVLGMALPVLPTTPFILLAAACFLKSSDRLHAWITSHETFGPHISDYLEGNGLQRKTKVVALSTLWLSIVVSTLFFVPLVAIDIALVAIATGVTIYILRLPTASKE